MVVPLYNKIFDEWEDLQSQFQDQPLLCSALEAGMDKLRKYYRNTDAQAYPVATIMDPRLKMHYYARQKWEQVHVQQARANLDAAFSRYETATFPAAGSGGGVVTRLKGDFLAEIYQSGAVVKGDELQNYLDAKWAVHQDQDILMWWKDHTGEYPAVSAMARDFLAIPATSASVERAFSGAKRLVSSDRCSLKANTIEACMCLRSWLRADM